MNKSPYLALSLLLSGLLLTACNKADDTKANTTSNAKDPNVVNVTPQLAKLIKVDLPGSGTINDVVRIPGRIEVNAFNTVRVGAPISGRITQIKVQPGDHIKQGATLAELNSADLGSAQLALLKAHSAEQLAKRAVERAELLLKSDVIGSAELLRRQNELSVASAEKRAAIDQLRVLGVAQADVNHLLNTGSITSNAPITASLAGTVIERRVAQGQVVQPADVLFVVSDLSTVWAVAEVPEQEALLVKRQQKVTVEVPALNNAHIQGQIAYVSDVVTPETRSVRVGVILENTEKQLKPEMLMTMLIEGHDKNVMLIPSTAVVRENNQDAIFVETAPNRYSLTTVKLGSDQQGRRALLSPLPSNQKIVLDGAFHLNNERNRINLGGQE